MQLTEFNSPFVLDQFYVLSCDWNYRGRHCYCSRINSKNECVRATETGVKLVHGNNRAFSILNIQLFKYGYRNGSIFHSLYELIKLYRIGDTISICNKFLVDLKRAFNGLTNASMCYDQRFDLTRHIETYCLRI